MNAPALLDWTPPAWFATARCTDGAATLTDLFFSEDLGEIARAKAICGACPARSACLEAAIARQEPWGVWGGELLMNGRVLAAKKRRGRPPKTARPEPVIDELGRVIGWVGPNGSLARADLTDADPEIGLEEAVSA